MSPPPLITAEWLRRRFEDGAAVPTMAAELGVHVSSIRRGLRRYGIAWRRQRQRIDDVEWLWRRYVDEGAPAGVMATELGASRSGVQYALRRAGLDRQDRGRRPASGPRRVAIGPLLRQVHLQGLTAAEAATLAGISLRHWQRCVAEGQISVDAGDRLACALGLHPALIWGE